MKNDYVSIKQFCEHDNQTKKSINQQIRQSVNGLTAPLPETWKPSAWQQAAHKNQTLHRANEERIERKERKGQSEMTRKIEGLRVRESV